MIIIIIVLDFAGVGPLLSSLRVKVFEEVWQKKVLKISISKPRAERFVRNVLVHFKALAADFLLVMGPYRSFCIYLNLTVTTYQELSPFYVSPINVLLPACWALPMYLTLITPRPLSLTWITS